MVRQDAYPRGKRTAKRGPDKRRTVLAVLLLSTTALTGIAMPARAADTTWTGANGDNDWFFTGNWDTGNIPSAADDVFINTDQGGSFPAIVNTNADAGQVNIGNSATGFLGISNTLLDAMTVTVGNGAMVNTQGLLNVVNGGAVTTTGDFMVGASSYGIAAFGSGTTLTVGGDAYIAYGIGATGQLTFSAGAAGTFSNNLSVGVGAGSDGTLGVLGDSDVDIVNNLTLGAAATAQGAATISGSGSTLDIGGLLTIGDLGAGAMTISDSAVVTMINGGAILGAQAGSSGSLTLISGGSFSTSALTGIVVGSAGAGTLSVGSFSDADVGFFTLGSSAGGNGSATVAGNGATLTAATTSHVGYDGIGSLTIADGGTVDIGGGAGTLNLATHAGSIGHLIIGDTGVPAGVLNAAAVEFGAGVGFLTFNHTDADYTFATSLMGAGTLVHLAGVTKLTGDSSAFTGITNVGGGELYVNNVLGGIVNLSGSGTLGGSGTLTGKLNVDSGGTIAPGNSIGILNVADIAFDAGSTYEVELNDSGNIAGVNNDIINATGVVSITGGTVHVTPENGTDDGSSYVPGVTYQIIHSTDSVVGTFDAVTDSYAFLNFVLNYDPDNVFLTSSVATSFCLTGMTVNQCAVGDGVFSLGAGSVFDAVVNLSDAEAPGALDQLSGEIHASARTALIEGSRFAREAAIDRLRQVPDDAAFWGQGFGSLAHWGGDGNAAGADRDLGGFFVGGDAPLGDDLRLGLIGGYGRSSFSIDDRMSSGTADTFTLGAYGGGEWAGLALRGGATYSWHSLELSRAVDFTGFSDSLSARYGAHSIQAFGEAAYSMEAGPARFEPFANLAYVNTSTDGFTETGGAAALISAGDVVGATFTTLGLRAETTVVVGEVEATLRGMLGWRHGFGDTPDVTLGFAAGGDAFTVAGVPAADDALVFEAGFDLNLTDAAALALNYQGLLGNGVSDHSARATLNVRF